MSNTLVLINNFNENQIAFKKFYQLLLHFNFTICLYNIYVDSRYDPMWLYTEYSISTFYTHRNNSI